jgi:anti-sigma factor RsiW
MSCEKFKAALIDAAASNTEPQGALRSHVESCESCAAELAEQRALIAAIDGSLHRQMNAPVSAAMLQRLEVRLAHEPQPKRAPRFAQIFAGAFATLAVAAAIIVVLPRQGQQTRDAKQINSQSAPLIDEARVVTQPQSATTEKLQPQISNHHIRVSSVRPSTKTASTHSSPEVLVPPDERIAFEHYLAGLRGQPGLVVAVANRAPQDLSVTPLAMPDIQTASLIVPPIRESAAVSDR